MDINARIKWQPGMELTAETFSALDENMDFRQLANTRANLGNRVGLMPGATFSCEGIFVRNTFEIDHLRCMCVLPSGWIAHVNERVVIPVPMLYSGEYYLTVTIGADQIEYEKEMVTMVRPAYEYAIVPLDKIVEENALPIVRFKVKDGSISIDNDYIPPCLILESDLRYAEIISSILEKLETYKVHPNLEPASKAQLTYQISTLKNLSLLNPVYSLISILSYVILFFDFYVVNTGLHDAVQIPTWDQNDTEHWLRWFNEYLVVVGEALDRYKPKEDKIDLDKLKQEIKDEMTVILFEQMKPELERQVHKRIEEVREEMRKEISEALKDYISGVFRKQLHDQLHDELDPELAASLYPKLYEDLYNALFVPVKEEEETDFIPLI